MPIKQCIVLKSTHSFYVWYKYISFKFYFSLFFHRRVSPSSSGCPGPHFVDQVGFELRNLPAFASTVLGLKAYAPTVISSVYFIYYLEYKFCIFIKHHSFVLYVYIYQLNIISDLAKSTFIMILC